MDFLQFTNRVLEEVKDRLPEAEGKVIVQPVLKNNGVSYMGLMVSDSRLNISPTIYLDPYYKKYTNGAPFEHIIDDVIKTYQDNLPSENFDLDLVKDWDLVKERVIRKLINLEANEKLLEDVPHKQVSDLAVVYLISVADFMGDYATILIHKNLFDTYDVTLDELDEIATSNTKKLSNYSFDNMQSILQNLTGQALPFLPEFDMYILTNEQRIQGAVHILDPEVQDKIAETVGNKFWVIPSSIHELLIIPYGSGDFTYDDYEALIQEVNETQLTEDEVLSNQVYAVDAKNHVFLPGKEFVEYERNMKYKQEKEMQIKEEEKLKKGPEPEIGPKL